MEFALKLTFFTHHQTHVINRIFIHINILITFLPPFSPSNSHGPTFGTVWLIIMGLVDSLSPQVANTMCD